MLFFSAEGPEFHTLDPVLQEAVFTFLAARGVDSSLAAFVLAYGSRKEQGEYVRWLHDFQDFVNAGQVLLQQSKEKSQTETDKKQQ
jgi:hypothetical protein